MTAAVTATARSSSTDAGTRTGTWTGIGTVTWTDTITVVSRIVSGPKSILLACSTMGIGALGRQRLRLRSLGCLQEDGRAHREALGQRTDVPLAQSPFASQDLGAQ